MKRKSGWKRDLPDYRDYSLDSPKVKALLASMPPNKISTAVDLRDSFSPIEDQQDIGSCTANAAAAIVEYFERVTYGKHLDISRLFLYYAARYLGGYFPGDNGAEIRNVVGALVLLGAPPEKFWPYRTKRVDVIPDSACFSVAQSFQALTYYRLDKNNASEAAVLQDVKNHLSNKIPVIFGFTCYASIDHQNVTNTGNIPFPSAREAMDGGHAVAAAGFDDDKIITNPYDGKTTKGALLIRNSWGTEWGEDGYGWLPYEYVLKGLAVDFWVLAKSEWLDLSQFGI